MSAFGGKAAINRDALDNFFVAGEGRRAGGLFYFTHTIAL
jgi:hypothetical protein